MVSLANAPLSPPFKPLSVKTANCDAKLFTSSTKLSNASSTLSFDVETLTTAAEEVVFNKLKVAPSTTSVI